jgi:TrpR-related protein YerC/YecD
MKRRPALQIARPASAAPLPPAGERLADLVGALVALRSADEVRSFLIDLCTPAELEAIADRWAVVPELAEGRAYRDIHDRTGVSVTTIGRVARCLSLGAGGYRTAAERLGHLAPGATFAAPHAEEASFAAPSIDDAH